MYTRYAEKEMKLYLGMDANGISFSKKVMYTSIPEIKR